MIARSGTRRPTAAPSVAALYSGAVCYELWGPGDPATLRDEERSLVAGAVEGRVSQFAAGRQCAHAALAEIDLDTGPLGRAEHRAPAWPAGVRGSIAHTDTYAVAAVARPAVDRDHRAAGLSIGLDAETTGRVTPELYPRLFTPSERERVASSPSEALAATVLFGLKEAFYKAQFPLTTAWVGFHDVDIEVDADPDVWLLRPATDLVALAAVLWPVRGRSLVRGDLVVTAVEVSPARS
jgi:4'-phosphopantetheinyl transferase EntD